MIKAIIIEDEKMSRETLRRLLEKYCPVVEVIAEADGYRKGLEEIRKHHPDVIFLDIQMPDGSGFRLLEEIETVDFEIIFTTAFDQFAIKAIKYSALDYLLKPIIPQDLIEAVDRVEKKKAEKVKRRLMEAIPGNDHAQEDRSHKIVLSTAEMIHVIDIEDIIRCESDNYYTYFYFTDGRKLLVSKTLKENEELLSQHNFIRPHKSHLINIKYIKSYIRQDSGYILMTDGTRIPVSRRKKDKIMEIIFNL
ncbi:MAG: LytTR family DNA-binding domain-containing protein [Bacteroidales bacterium]|jgi:two-component system LytT family response regulator|nr:LytTR family DNA-binding domain-containing protein [Bacteroidales bacterium]